MSIYVDIKKSFGDFSLDIAFEAENEVLALLGASGCGKSMTLKCIAGVVKPDEGRIVIDGVTLFDSEKHINLSPQRRRVGLLFQNYALFPNMTVRQNIMSVLKRGDKTLNREQRFKSLTERFYISGLEEHYPTQLSGGQQQRVALARILASDPSMIMLDEPLSALDSYLRWQLERELVDMLEDFSGTTLYVSHNRDEAYRICSRVCVMNNGRSEKIRRVDELIETPGTLAAALLSGCKNYSRIERLNDKTLRALDWNIELHCEKIPDADAEYIGVRAHCVRPCCETEENAVKCRVIRVTQDVFSTIFTLLPENADSNHDFSYIRMELPKAEAEAVRPNEIITVQILPENIMPIKK